MKSDSVKFRIADVNGEDRDTDEFTISLPSVISELGLQVGDYTYLEWVDFDSAENENEPPYIRCVKSEKVGTSTEGYLKIRGGRELKLPKQWEDYFSRPLYQVALEFYFNQDPHFRVYQLIDFALYRTPELIEQGYDLEQLKPLVLAPVWNYLDESGIDVDVASHTPFPGRRFNLIPYDANDEAIKQRTFRSVSGSFEPRPTVLREIVEEGEIRKYQPDSLTIEWDPSDSPHSEWYPIYKKDSVREVDIILPAKGSFLISTETSYGRNGTRIEYVEDESKRENDVHDLKWRSHSIVEGVSSDAISVFIPCQTTSD